MANRTISIEIQNGALGQLAPSEDGLFGLILQSDVAPTGLALLTPTEISSLQAAEDLGIGAAFDTANSVKCHKVLKNFFSEAVSGTKLWIMFTAQTVVLADIFDKANTYASTLVGASNGNIRLLSAVRSFAAGYSEDTTANEVDLDVVTAMTNAQALVEEFRSKHMPFACIIPGHHYTDDESGLVDLSQRTDKWVSGLIGDTESGKGCAVGLLLGRLSQIGVDKEAGRVKDGALAITDAYLDTTKIDLNESLAAVRSIETKGWITFTNYVNKSGYFFTNAWTATARTDDFDRLARVRIIQKAERIVYDTYLNEILDDIQLDATTGQLSTNAAKYYQNLIQSAIDGQLLANGEISGLSVQIDPTQDVLSTGEVCIELRLVPDAYANSFKINLGYDNPANS